MLEIHQGLLKSRGNAKSGARLLPNTCGVAWIGFGRDWDGVWYGGGQIGILSETWKIALVFHVVRRLGGSTHGNICWFVENSSSDLELNYKYYEIHKTNPPAPR